MRNIYPMYLFASNIVFIGIRSLFGPHEILRTRPIEVFSGISSMWMSSWKNSITSTRNQSWISTWPLGCSTAKIHLAFLWAEFSDLDCFWLHMIKDNSTKCIPFYSSLYFEQYLSNRQWTDVNRHNSAFWSLVSIWSFPYKAGPFGDDCLNSP